MTAEVVQPLPPLLVGQQAVVTLTVTGASPVHNVIIDFPADGGPAWYYVPWDGRGTLHYLVGPLRKKGRMELTVLARDEMGCEVTNGVRVYATIQ